MYMPRNPFTHAAGAALYIVGIVHLISLFVDGKVEGTLLIPMVMLSLLVLSALVMGYLFLYEPIMLYLDGKKKESLAFFGKTVAFFACFAITLVLILIYL